MGNPRVKYKEEHCRRQKEPRKGQWQKEDITEGTGKTTLQTAMNLELNKCGVCETHKDPNNIVEFITKHGRKRAERQNVGIL